MVDAASQPVEPETRPKPIWHRWLLWAVGIVVIGAIADLLGWNIRDWFKQLWDTITAISFGYVVGALLLIVVQTTATAFAWYSILHYAYPRSTRWKDILAAYAVSVGLNCILPANIGTLVMLIMFSVIIAGATFASILGAYAVEKIFFTLSGAFVYLYLFLSVGGSFDIKFSFVHERPVATIVFLAGGVFMIYLVLRRLWPRVVEWWDQAKEGGAILAEPRKYILRVFLPSLIGWVAAQANNAVLFAAYDIPVSFSNLMRLAGGNSIANVTSITPGGAGVNQAFNVASLKGVADPTTITAYSVADQLLTTAFDIAFANGLMIWAWGWTGGKALVQQSYDEAKKRQEEELEKRRQKKAARAAERGEVVQ